MVTIAAGIGALCALVFFIAFLVSWGDAGWAFGAVAGFLGVAAVLSAFSTVYAVFNMIGVKVKHDPGGPYTWEKDSVHLWDVVVIVVITLVLAGLAFGVSQISASFE
jgi:hypothetical protein